MDIKAGSRASGRRQRGAVPALLAFRALTRPVPGDGVLPVVDIRDTAIVGYRNLAIEHDLACLPGHVVNRSEPAPRRPSPLRCCRWACAPPEATSAGRLVGGVIGESWFIPTFC